MSPLSSPLSHLLDASAFHRSHRPAVQLVLEPLVLNGAVARCGVLELELLFGARNQADFFRTRRNLTASLPLVATEQRDFDRAADVLELLARRGQHRAVKLPDLILAAIAERAALTVLHYDQDYDVIANLTGQPVQWIVPRGSVP